MISNDFFPPEMAVGSMRLSKVASLALFAVAVARR